MMELISKLIVATMLLSSSQVMAQNRCPASDMGCDSSNYEQKIKDRIEEGKRDVSEAKGPIKKARAVGRTIEDCTDCGLKVLGDKLSTATPQ